MRVHPGRILGLVMGLVILATIFLIPFSSSQSLYGIVNPLLSDMGMVQQSGFANAVADYVMIIAFILLIIAGVVGVFPLGTGVLGVVAMAMVTVGPILIYPNIGAGASYDAGFYVIWVASIIALAASFWHRRRNTKVVNNTMTAPTM
jgi:hypothetical protein